MGHSQAEKARSRERILAEASRQIRDGGLESVSVGALMKSVGLTHGGFYGHFESRDVLITEALERALSESEAKTAANGAHGRASFAQIVRGYLSRNHRDSRDSGCAVAALASDAARADAAPRGVMSEHVETFFDTVAQSLGGDDESAMVAVSAMVGALTLSRVVDDPQRSHAILKAMRDHLATLEAGVAS